MPKYTIYLAESQDERHLAPRISEEGQRSGIIQRALDRYEEACRRSLPGLSVPEWKLVCDSLNGVMHEPAAQISVMWAGIEDSIRLDGLDRKWDVDGPALVERLRAMDYAEQLALVDYAERYWAAVARGESPKVPGEA